MNKLQRRLLLIIILVFASFGNLQAQTRVFSEAKFSVEDQASYDSGEWNFSVGRDRLEIKKDGKAKITNVKNKVAKFRIKLEEEELLERAIYFAQYKNDLLLICEVNVAGSGSGFIVRLDGKTLITKWQTNISSFNTTKGLIENESAYLAASGFAAKINLDTGKYLWKHDDFYRKYKEEGAFNIFETPRIEGNIITFTENRDDYNRPPNVIKFNKNSGKVIEVKVK